MRLRGHLVRAKSVLADGSRFACERDVEAVFKSPGGGAPTRESLDASMPRCLDALRCCAETRAHAPTRESVIVVEYSVAPYDSVGSGALSQVPGGLEIEEVAENIWRDLANVREAGSDGSGSEWVANHPIEGSE